MEHELGPLPGARACSRLAHHGSIADTHAGMDMTWADQWREERDTVNEVRSGW